MTDRLRLMPPSRRETLRLAAHTLLTASAGFALSPALANARPMGKLVAQASPEEEPAPAETDQAAPEAGFDNPMDGVGAFHNTAVSYVLTHLSSPPAHGEIESVTNAKLAEFFGLIHLGFEPPKLWPWPEDLHALDLKAIVEKAVISKELKRALHDLLDLISSAKSLSEFESQLDALNERITSASQDKQPGGLTERDLMIFLIITAVAAHSAVFWTRDGLEELQRLAERELASLDWKQILGCDAIGAAFSGAPGAMSASLTSAFTQIEEK